MGIPLELFVDRASVGLKNGYFKCKFCNCVLNDPKWFPNWKLGSYICGTCVPSCFGTELAHSPPRNFVNALESLVLRCPFHASGCKFISTLGGMDAHAAECLFSEIIQGPPNPSSEIVKSAPEPEMKLNQENGLSLDITKLKQDLEVEMYKNEAEAMKDIAEGLKLKLIMQEIQIGAFRAKADAADLIQRTNGNKLTQAVRISGTQDEFPASSQLEICGLKAQLAIQKLEFQLETQKLESQLTIQKLEFQLQLQFRTQSQHSKNDAEFLPKQLLDKFRQLEKLSSEMDQLKQELVDKDGQVDELRKALEAKAEDVGKLVAEVAPLKLQLTDNEQVIDDLKMELETNVLNAVNMKLRIRVAELMAELSPLKLQLADRNQQLDRVKRWGHKNKCCFDCLREYPQLCKFCRQVEPF